MKFPQPICVPFRNAITGAPYTLCAASTLSSNPATIARITAICNEPDVYEFLFRTAFDGRRYQECDAHRFLKWIREAWIEEPHFAFVALNADQRLAAACSIKSNSPSAEIGYWASREDRGVMTNAVKVMCTLAREAGFEQLSARVRRSNLRSAAVLSRASFIQVPSDSEELRYERPLKTP